MSITLADLMKQNPFIKGTEKRELVEMCYEKVIVIIDDRIAEINKEEFELSMSDLSSKEKKLLGLGIKRARKELIQIMGE